MAKLVPTTLPRLCERTLPLLPTEVGRPAYDRAATRLGVVHFGPGAFHRAHQAEVFDRILATDPRFAVCAVSLRSDDVRAALEPQDGLYALFEREADPRARVIGSITRLLTAPRSPEAVRAVLANPGVRFVTATVTEKGYGLTASGDLDVEAPAIRRDLTQPRTPHSLLLTPDHYLYRMLFSQGVPLDKLGVPDRNGIAKAEPREAWRLLASNMRLFRGTPSALWLNHVFGGVFGFEVALEAETADLYFDRIGELLATPAFRPRALFCLLYTSPSPRSASSAPSPGC